MLTISAVFCLAVSDWTFCKISINNGWAVSKHKVKEQDLVLLMLKQRQYPHILELVKFDKRDFLPGMCLFLPCVICPNLANCHWIIPVYTCLVEAYILAYIFPVYSIYSVYYAYLMMNYLLFFLLLIQCVVPSLMYCLLFKPASEDRLLWVILLCLSL